MDVAGPDHDGLPLAGIKRGNALTVLRDGPVDRAALMERLDVSRTTIHRIVRALEARDIVEQRGNEFELTTFGETVADEVAAYRRRIRAAGHLKPFLEMTPDLPVDIDVGLFERAHVTEMEPTDPYGPVARFMELLADSETLYGFDTTTVAPIYVDEIRDEILGGMETDVVYLPAVAEDIVDTYASEITAAVESGHLTLSTHEELPFGLAVFDDRVGLGGYDPETGMLRAFVDTADPEAREWGLDLYERYREAATPMELSSVTCD